MSIEFMKFSIYIYFHLFRRRAFAMVVAAVVVGLLPIENFAREQKQSLSVVETCVCLDMCVRVYASVLVLS